MTPASVSTIRFALFPDYNLRLSIHHNVNDPFTSYKKITQSIAGIKQHYVLMDPTHIVSLQQIAVAATTAIQRREEAIMKESINNSNNHDDRKVSNLAKDIILAIGGSTNAATVLAEFSFDSEHRPVGPRSYSVLALGINYSSDQEFLSETEKVGLSPPGNLCDYLSRHLSDEAFEHLVRIYRLTKEEVEWDNHSSLINAIVTRIATKFCT